MKFKIKARDFSRTVERARLFSAPDMTHPAYTMTKVQVTSNGSLRLSTINAISGCRFMAVIEDGSEPGSVCVPSSVIQSVSNSLDADSTVTFKHEDGGPMKFSATGGYKGSLPVADSSIFPELKSPPKEGWVDLASDELVDAVDKTAWAAGHDHHNRPILTGIHMTTEHTTAASGYHVARSPLGLVSEGEAIIPAVFMNCVRIMVSKDPQELKICTDNQFWVRGKGWAVYTTQIMGEYFKVDPVLYEPQNEIHISRPHLKKAISRIMTSVGGCPIAISVEEGEIVLSSWMDVENKTISASVSQRVPFVAASDDIDISSLGRIIIDSKFFEMAVMPLSGETVRMIWVNKTTPVQFRDDKGTIVATATIDKGQ